MILVYDSTMTDASEVVRYMDFETSEEPVRFRIAPDVFEAVPDISIDNLADLAKMRGIRTSGSDVDLDEMKVRLLNLLDGILTPDSAALMRERCAKGHPKPVGFITLTTRVLPWLMEVYGLRPTQPSSDSQTGSDDTSITSTDGASSEA